MDNKIKIVISFIIVICLFLSCSFDGNIGLYEIKINDWAEITYWLQNKNNSGSLHSFRLFITKKNLEINKRYELDDYDRDNQILQSSRKLIYNNDFIIADDGHNGNDSIYDKYSKYFKIKPIGDRGGGKCLPFTSVQITREEYDSIEANCLDCKVLDISMLQKIHYEEEQNEKNSFPIKTVVFFSLILLYIFYKVYKKKKAKKPNRKNE